MKYIIFSCILGAILAICGITVNEWQFWAILLPTNTFLVFFTK